MSRPMSLFERSCCLCNLPMCYAVSALAPAFKQGDLISETRKEEKARKGGRKKNLTAPVSITRLFFPRGVSLPFRLLSINSLVRLYYLT